MSALPGVLDAEEQDPFAGSGMLYDVASLCRRLEDGDWVVASLHGVGALSAGASLLADPVAGLSSAVAGWAMEHVAPLRAHLDDLAGDPGAVMAGAGRLLDSGERLETLSADLVPGTARHLEDAEGLTVAACRGFSHAAAAWAAQAAALQRSAARAVRVAAGIVEAVRSFLRDAIAEVVGMAASSAVTVVLSGGIATVAVGGRVLWRVSQLTDRATDLMRAVVRSVEALRQLLGRAGAAVDLLARLTRSRRPLRVPAGSGGPPVEVWTTEMAQQLTRQWPSGIIRQAGTSGGIRVSDGPQE